MTPKELKTLRRELGLSQEALARDLGVARVTIARWETTRTIPALAAQLIRLKYGPVLAKLAKAEARRKLRGKT